MAERKRGRGYSSELPRRMYTYFSSYCDQGAPSFGKFARSIGSTLEELESFKVHKNFERAWRECGEIRRDYLIDCALTKRHDSSFTKFLLELEASLTSDESENKSLELTLEVLNK